MAFLVIIEHRDGRIAAPSFQALGEARRLADVLKRPLAAILLGSQLDSTLEELNKSPIDKIFVLQNEALKDYTAEGYTEAILDLLSTIDYGLWTILLSATFQGKDLAPRLAAKLDIALFQDCTKIETTSDGSLVFHRPVYAGKLLERAVALSKNSIATLRPKVFEPTPPVGCGKDTEVIKTDAKLSQIKTKVLDIVKDPGKKLDVSEADIIVSGGRGMKGPENFKLLEDLAAVLGGAVGASRAAVDAGWRPHSDQVGQTGKVVTPKLYIACGISGAIQHLVGMSSSKCIVAINKDPQAPIFKKADYGIVGDVFEVVPALIEELKK